MTTPVRGRRHGMRTAAPGLCVGLLLAVAGCDGADGPARPVEDRPLLQLTFDDLENLANGGSAEVSVDVVALGEGRLRVASGVEEDPSAGFPAFRADAAADPVAVVVRSTSQEDSLSPGEAPFRFGADVRLDRESQGSEVDDGNNVVQRGLFDGPQYKLQVDRGVASCRVAGSSGSVFVEEQQPMRAEEWYRIECSRDGDELTLRTTPLERQGDVSVARARGSVGALTFRGEKAPPLSIGCKVDGQGRPIASSTDQLNGAVDNVFLDVSG